MPEQNWNERRTRKQYIYKLLLNFAMITIRQSKASLKNQVQIFGFSDSITETSADDQGIGNIKNISRNSIIMGNAINSIDVLSVSEFAREASVTPQAVRKMINENRITAFRIGEQYVIEKNELFKYLGEK